jgi:ABC-type multidrug transport system ATPase subunit
MTGREHVQLYAAIKGVPPSEVQAAVDSKLAEVGLSEFDSNRLSQGYSGGMKRKLQCRLCHDRAAANLSSLMNPLRVWTQWHVVICGR